MKKDFIDFLLNELRRRPGMFLTAPKLSYFEIFLTGIQIAGSQFEKNNRYLESFFGKDGFLEWSWRKYNLIQPSVRLRHYIDLADESDDAALQLFFSDLEVFHSEAE